MNTTKAMGKSIKKNAEEAIFALKKKYSSTWLISGLYIALFFLIFQEECRESFAVLGLLPYVRENYNLSMMGALVTVSLTIIQIFLPYLSKLIIFVLVRDAHLRLAKNAK